MKILVKPLEKQKLSSSSSALFHMKTRVSLRYFVNNCNLSHFTFCVSCKIDGDCLFVELGVVNVASSAVDVISSIVVNLYYHNHRHDQCNNSRHDEYLVLCYAFIVNKYRIFHLFNKLLEYIYTTKKDRGSSKSYFLIRCINNNVRYNSPGSSP